MKFTYSIKLVLRPDKIKADGTIPIYWALRYTSGTNRLPTGICILLKDWDVSNNRFKNNSKENQLLNTLIDKRKSEFNTFMLESLAMGKPMSLTIASNFFRGETKENFYTYFERQIELWTGSSAKEYNTIKSYRSTLNVLKAFRSKLEFGELTPQFIKEFDYHMSTKRGNAAGGKFTKHKCLKSIIRQAVSDNVIKASDNPYNGFKIKAVVGKRQFLTIAEVNAVMQFEIPEKNGFLKRVRDLFVFSCVSGLRYSDVINLKWSNVDVAKRTITVEMTKTKKQIVIPLVPQALDILNDYGKHIIKVPTAKVLPQMTNQVLNRELKVLMKEVGIDKEISFHCARHSFASNLIEAKTNILFVRDLLGHSNLSETQIYAKALMTDLQGTMENLSSLYGKAV